jgi:hypothetical protein
MVERPAQVIEHVEEIEGALNAGLRGKPVRATLARLQARVDEHFDVIARVVATSAASRCEDATQDLPTAIATQRWMNAQLRAYREAHRARTEQLAADRLVFADQVVALEGEVNDLQARIAELEQTLLDRAVLADRDAQELARLRATKTFRYLGPLRRIYGRLR